MSVESATAGAVADVVSVAVGVESVVSVESIDSRVESAVVNRGS